MNHSPIVLYLSLVATVAMPLTVATAKDTNDCPLTNKDLADIGISTKIIAVPEIAVPASQYKSDGDADTLELVFLKDKSDGQSRVSDDGEIIFLQGKVKDKTQQELFTQAFYIRAVLKMKLIALCIGPWTQK